MLNIEKSISALISFILSAVIVISILSKFSFLLPIQVSIFLILLLVAMILINNYKIKINSYIVLSVLLLLLSLISYINADFKINVRDYIVILCSALLAGFNFSFLSIDFKKKVFFVPVFIALWLSMILFTRFISAPQNFFVVDNFYETMALNINVIAAFLVLVYPLFFIFIKENKNVKVFIIMMLFVLFAIFLTKSRISILLSFVSTIIFLLEYRKNKYVKFLIIATIVALISVIIYASFLKSNFSSVPHRLIWWKTAILMFKENIFFGCGLGNYTVLFKAFRPELVLNTLYAHNIILELLAEIGIVGLLSFISLILMFYIKFIDKVIEGKDLSFYVPISLSVTSFLIMNLVDYSFFVPANMLMFFIILSSIFDLYSQKIQKNKVNIIILIIVFSVFASFIVKPVIGQIFLKKGIEFYVANQYKLAIEEFEKAISFDKGNPEYYAQVSRSYFALYDKMRGEVGQLYADKSIEYNKKAIDLYKHSGELRASLAAIYWNSGQKELALNTMQEAIKYDRFNPYFEENFYQMRNS